MPAQIEALLDREPQFQVVGITKAGREGIELARQVAPEIVLIDTTVHDVNAIECVSLVKNVAPGAKVIMMPIATDAEYLKKAMQAGARFFLGKPLDKDEFVSTIRHVLT
jgi:DNA-binding NarL/FixJ family response regulator